MNLENSEQLEVYKDCKDKYNKIRDQFLYLFKEYENKDRISILLEYWLWNIKIIFLVYGKTGVTEFLESEILTASRFSIFKPFS